MSLLNLKLDKKYTLVFNVGGKILTYTGTIIACDENFIKFKDKFGDEFNYNISTLISSQEIFNGVQQ